jgi:hypothetical protein
MHVIIKSSIENADVYIKGVDRSSLCQLKMFNSTCLVRGDFIAEVLDSKGAVKASSDKFSAWWGDDSYNTANTTMVLTWKGDAGSYLNMTNEGF